MEPQVTGLPWSLGHWVIGLLGHSKFIHPSITTIGSIYPRVRVTWLAIHPRVMTTKPLIHPSIQTRVKWLPIYPGSQGQGLHPSIHPGSWLPEPSIQTIDIKPFIHPGHRPQTRVSIYPDHDHRPIYPSRPQVTDQGLYLSKVTDHKPNIHPRHQGQGHRSQVRVRVTDQGHMAIHPSRPITPYLGPWILPAYHPQSNKTLTCHLVVSGSHWRLRLSIHPHFEPAIDLT